MDVVDELRAAVAAHREWPTAGSKATVVYAAQRFVDALDARAAVIAQMRAHVTPSEQALQELLGPQP